MTPFQISHHLLSETFEHFRECGCGQRECQVLWASSWQSPLAISRVIHSQHSGHAGGFNVESPWLTKLWLELAAANEGIRIQVHTHPQEAFHSEIDDGFPIIHSEGFLSLVIPDFGVHGPTLERAYLTEISTDGRWNSLPIEAGIVIVP